MILNKIRKSSQPLSWGGVLQYLRKEANLLFKLPTFVIRSKEGTI